MPPDDTKQSVSFDSVDDVKLVGTFYKGPKGIDSPTVILMHRFQSDRTAKGWDQLARDLQGKLNCAVLAIDFRGHGGSKAVTSKFWANYSDNRNGIRGGTNARTKNDINYTEFKGSYWPMLLNDMAAARHYIDLQNDAQKCNASSIIVIAAQDTAGLAMGWAVHEWERKSVPAATSIVAINPTVADPGEDLAACVWLGPTGRGGGVTFRTTEWFNRCSKLRENTPMYFLYGKQDSNSAGVVPGMYGAVRRPPEGSRSKHAFDKEEALATRLPGQDLLGNPALNVNEKIVAWLEGVLKARKNQAWKSMNPGPQRLFPLQNLGYAAPG
jgi:pimeloyl-ACP methyl ester carboxylesterase